ncbi:M23 family metallopeptidase [Paenibacillus sp. HB172176]|uniref:M23 family metallopeptidase n=1 Tax=Paenibacillus sp. HB172176 TaxID=2493690 RepID=UPI00143C8C4C|nr:M23 family metallopeptidase [Paenibacillus sp. HB172176]
MTGFRDLGRMKELWKKSTNYFRRTNSLDLSGKTEQQAANVMVSSPLWRKKSVQLASGAAILLITAGIIGYQQYTQYIEKNTFPFYHVYQNGEEIGTVGSPEDVEQLIASETQQLQEANPDVNMELETGDLTYERDNAFKAEPATDNTLKELEAAFTSHAVGVEVKVDGKLIGIVKDQETADSILERVQSKYAPELVADVAKKSKSVSTLSYSSEGGETEKSTASASAAPDLTKPGTVVTDVAFVEAVEMDDVDANPTDIEAAEDVYKKIITGSTKPTKYTVQAGDCIGCIAQKFDISPQVIYENNDWIEDDKITVGDVLDLTVLQPELTVKTTENLVQLEAIAPPIEVKKNDTMRVGQSKTIQAGVDGQQRLTYKVEKENGYVVSEELINQEVLKEAVPEIIEKGTLVIKGVGSGKFIYPIKNHKISSTFGWRWGRQHNGIDMTGSKSVMAADAGVVTYAGYDKSRGNYIILDHQNGFETYYEHLSSFKVKKGEKVEQGDVIAIMGNTGNSTGTHLHFEIHKNGVIYNPLKYL